MKLFEIIIHSIFLLLSITALIMSIVYNSSEIFFTGFIILCVSSVILLAGQSYKVSKEL